MAKARTRERHAGIEDGNPVADLYHHENDTVAVVREIIFGLHPDTRDVIVLRYYKGMTYEQIAGLLGISEEAVNGKLRRARDTIRQELQRRESMEIEP
jgi:RNA polymerase sigma factor (sigma-70 family)